MSSGPSTAKRKPAVECQVPQPRDETPKGQGGDQVAPWAALFDWDGVVVDSSRAHEQSWVRLSREEGNPLPPEHFRRGFGMKNEVIIPKLLGWTREPAEIRRLSLRKEALYREIIKEQGLHPLPGLRPFLERLRAAAIPCVIGSSTHLVNITAALEILGLTGWFRGIVSAEDVHHGKPDPEVFLLAAGKLGVAPARCIVFEDALVGIEAARNAGMKVVAVATTNQADALAHADRVVHRLDELEVPDLSALLAARS